MGPCEQLLKRNMEAYKTIEQVSSTTPKDIPYGITNPIPHFSGVQRVPSNQLPNFPTPNSNNSSNNNSPMPNTTTTSTNLTSSNSSNSLLASPAKPSHSNNSDSEMK